MKDMRLIVAGSRDITDYRLVEEAINTSPWWKVVTEVVSGGARGVDSLGEQWAKKSGVRVKRFIPDWKRGRNAGMLRNTKMAQYADALVAVWNGESPGTRHMILTAAQEGLPIFVWPGR